MSKEEIEKNIAVLKEMFKNFDKDGNGTIDRSELSDTMIKELGIPLSEEDISNMIKDADKNNDGKIDYEEFVTIMKNNLGL